VAKYRETLAEDRRVLLDRYRLVDAAIKVVGIGSVGTLCMVALMMSIADHPFFLQIKQANASVLEAYAGKSVLGEVEITRVLEFEAALFEPVVIHPDASPEIIERHLSWLSPTLMDPTSGLMIFAFHSTVIKTPHATILIDTCSGNDKERPHKLRYHRKNWPYLTNLAAAGFAPEDIDYVLCTHLHADHVGWNTRLLNGRWVPTFPNARYLFAREEWEHWRVAESRAAYTTDPYYEDSLLPVMESGQAELVATDYAFDDGVWIP
jgi:Uncharacterized protein conserved in bacteria (DUF2252)/Metallo-beta-lactamase superfamily